MDIDRRGVWFALAAYGLWGVAPVYFKFLGFADPTEVVAHRVVWSVVLLAVVITLRGGWRTVRALTAPQLGWLAVSGLLISGNWVLFVWAVFNDRMLDASLGYFINPLLNVVLGVMFFREWLRPAQRVALALAAIGVANEVVAVGVVPWVGLVLALSFGLYGLVRKRLAVGSAVGLGMETTLVLPLAAGYLLTAASAGEGSLARGDPAQLALLAAAGPVTVLPLVCFAAAAVRLPLSVLGFFQYIAPSAMFLLAVFVYGEPFRPSQLVTFGCIWAALVIFSWEALYHQRRLHRQLAGGKA
ncbi:MAG: protein RarD [Gammaproteobacteria bacterium]|nr:protein RarD [Gammaproteobacteria bacterium]